MPPDFAPRLDILPPPQRRLWQEMVSVPPETVDRDGLIKLSFFGLPNLPRLLPPHIAPDNGRRVASLLDLAGMKVSVVQMRAEAKVDVDIDALLTDGGFDLAIMLPPGSSIRGPGPIGMPRWGATPPRPRRFAD